MCAMDRSSDQGLSQSVRETILHIKALYKTSPVSVCVRNQQRDVLYSNTAFEQIYDFFKTEGVTGSFSGSFNELELMLYQLELDCMVLGRGCVLSKIFSCGKSKFQIRIECISILDDEFYFLWQINLLITVLLPSRNLRGIKSKEISNFDEAIARISDLNIIPLSFYVLGFSYADISRYIGVSEKVVKKRIDRSKEKLLKIYPFFSSFILDCYKTRKIYFFVENVYEYVMLNPC
ncbi:sigma factor-like helix-turn-helix DNA-binding protein [Klebsiella oxytoca]|uniref:sigma factor-like helix-turn-helix DNA-binding protein n=1 Tax=Klebsiella oxytoca TaxID=571 RepID=UPI00115AB5C8|nr:sigma factor-like helix-turn-helix DNA-binding protein [Klebsiella oxytoca]HEJ7645692.1 hypothetical protein [Klebsiella oxytoca]